VAFEEEAARVKPVDLELAFTESGIHFTNLTIPF
jgi:hypothetical protein